MMIGRRMNLSFDCMLTSIYDTGQRRLMPAVKDLCSFNRETGKLSPG